MKSLILIAVVFAAAVVNAAEEECYFDPIEACKHCLYGESYNQYAVNTCNCTIYYHCEITRGKITAHQQLCDACHCFSKDTWGCTDWIKDDPSCHQPLYTEAHGGNEECCWRAGDGAEGPYQQFYRPVYDRPDLVFGQDLYYYWVVNGWPFLMPCPDGTYFDVGTCQCLNCYPGHPTGCVHHDTLVFCLDFENDGAERGIWYNQDSSCSINKWSYDLQAAHSLHMPGAPCDIEIPYFQNNEFREFTLCGAFNTANAGLTQGLAFNGGKPGDDCYPGSIEISLQGGYVYGEIKTDAGTPPLQPYYAYYVTHPLHIAAGLWYRVCLVYDGKNLELAVKLQTYPITPVTWADVVSVPAIGVTKRNKCNFMIGANFDNSGTQNFFHGEIDDWCFWRTAEHVPNPTRWF